MPSRAHVTPAIAAMLLSFLSPFTLLFAAARGGGAFFAWVAYAFWFAYMFNVDTARRIMVLAWRVEGEKRRA